MEVCQTTKQNWLQFNEHDLNDHTLSAYHNSFIIKFYSAHHNSFIIKFYKTHIIKCRAPGHQSIHAARKGAGAVLI